MKTTSSFKPDHLWLWAALTAALRLLLIAAACAGARLGIEDLALLHDGWEYLRLAAAWAGAEVAGPGGVITWETLRLAPGYPLAIAALGVRQPALFATAALTLSISGAAAAGLLTAHLAGGSGVKSSVPQSGSDNSHTLPSSDAGVRLAAVMAILTPSWLVFTATAMSEGLAIALTLGALLLMQRERWVAAGAVAGLAYLARPVGILLIAPLLVEAAARREGRRGPLAGAAILFAIAALQFGADTIMWAAAKSGAAVYTAKDFDWPLRTMALGLAQPAAEPLRWALVAGTLAVSALGGWGLWRGWHAGRAAWRALLAWHAAAGLFYLLLPSSWTFGCMDRFMLAVWPTALIGLSPWIARIPRTLFWLGLVAAGAASFGVAYLWLTRLAAIFPFADRVFQ